MKNQLKCDKQDCGATAFELLDQCFENGTKHIAAKCIKCGTFKQWVPQSTGTVEEITMPFGKHKGTKLAEVPKDYLEWLIKNTDSNFNKKIKAFLGVA
jgi:hypothetical protein